MAIFDFYDAGTLRQIATNLFYGWGYNFYRLENQLRADDLLVRSKASWLLSLAAQSVATAESDYRREFLPPPSRKQPFPPADAVAAAQSLERLHAAILALGSRIAAQPAPENDRMSQRYRQEAPTLQVLIQCDEQLIGQAEMLRQMLDAQSAASILDQQNAAHVGLEAIASTLRAREASLLSQIH